MISYKVADQKDLPALQELNLELFVDNQQYDKDLDMNWSKSKKGEKLFLDLLNNPEAICLIAFEDKQAIGYLAASPRKLNDVLSKYLEINNVEVLPNFQSKGIGSELIKRCLEWAKEKAYQKVYVNSYFENKRAVYFYKRNGFSEIDLGLQQDL